MIVSPYILFFNCYGICIRIILLYSSSLLFARHTTQQTKHNKGLNENDAEKIFFVLMFYTATRPPNLY